MRKASGQKILKRLLLAGTWRSRAVACGGSDEGAVPHASLIWDQQEIRLLC